MYNKKILKQISYFLLLVFTLTSIDFGSIIKVNALENVFSSKGGHASNGYEQDAAAPTVFNWIRNSRYSAPTVPINKWKFKTDAAIDSSPVVSKEGNIFFGGNDSYFYCIDNKGTLKWKFKTDANIVGSPAISSKGIVYVNDINGTLYSFNKEGKLIWKTISTNTPTKSSPVIAEDGTIYYSYLIAVNPADGSIKNKKYISGTESTAAISNDGDIYIGSGDGKLYALDMENNQKWSYATGGSINSSPIIAEDGTVYVGSDDTYIYAITKEGKLKWKTKLDSTIESSGAISKNGEVYITTTSGYLYCIKSDGSISWNKQVGDITKSSPVIDNQGNIILGNGQSYNEKGNLNWSIPIKNTNSSPIINSDGTILVGSSDSNLYAIGEAGNTKISIENINKTDDTYNNKIITGTLRNTTSSSESTEIIVEGYNTNGKLVSINTGNYFISANGTSDFSLNLDYGSQISDVKVYAYEPSTDDKAEITKFEVVNTDNGRRMVGLVKNNTDTYKSTNILFEGYDANNELVYLNSTNEFVSDKKCNSFNVNLSDSNVVKVNAYVSPTYSDGKTEFKKIATTKTSDSNMKVSGILSNGTDSSQNINILTEGYDVNGNLIYTRSDNSYVSANSASIYDINIDNQLVNSAKVYVGEHYLDGKIEVKKQNSYKDGSYTKIVGFYGNGNDSSENFNAYVEGTNDKNEVIYTQTANEYIYANSSLSINYNIYDSNVTKGNVIILPSYNDGNIEIKKSNEYKDSEGRLNVTGIIGNGTDSYSNSNLIAEGYDSEGKLVEIKTSTYYAPRNGISDFNICFNNKEVVKQNCYIEKPDNSGVVTIPKYNLVNDNGKYSIIGLVSNGMNSDFNGYLLIKGYDSNNVLKEIKSDNISVYKNGVNEFSVNVEEGLKISKVEAVAVDKPEDNKVKIEGYTVRDGTYNSKIVNGVISNGTDNDIKNYTVISGYDSNKKLISMAVDGVTTYRNSLSNFSTVLSDAENVSEVKADLYSTPVDSQVKILQSGINKVGDKNTVSAILQNGTTNNLYRTVAVEGLDKDGNTIEYKSSKENINSNSLELFKMNFNEKEVVDYKIYLLDDPNDNSVKVLKSAFYKENNNIKITGLLSNGTSQNQSVNLIAEVYDENDNLLETTAVNRTISKNEINQFSCEFDNINSVKYIKVYTAPNPTANEIKFLNAGVKKVDDNYSISYTISNGESSSKQHRVIIEGYNEKDELVYITSNNIYLYANSVDDYTSSIYNFSGKISKVKAYLMDSPTNDELIKYSYYQDNDKLHVDAIIGNTSSTDTLDTGYVAIAYDSDGNVLGGSGNEIRVQPNGIGNLAIDCKIVNKTVAKVELKKMVKGDSTSNDANNRPENNPDAHYAERIIDLNYVKPEGSQFDSFYGSNNNADLGLVNPYEVLKANTPNSCLSLPAGSYVTLGFDYPANESIFVEETGAAGDYGLVLVSSDLKTYEPLGVALNGTVTQFNLASLGYNKPVLAVKIIGLDLNGEFPGYDVVNVWAGKKCDYAPGAITGEEAANIIYGRNSIRTCNEDDKSSDSYVDDPVDTSSGAQQINRTLLTEKGGQELNLDISYNSLLHNKGVMGNGWSHNFDINITEEGKNAILHWGPNKLNRFMKYDDKNYLPLDGANQYDKLTKENDNTYTYENGNHERYRFDKDGKITEKKNKNGQTIYFYYDSNRSLNKVKDDLTNHYFDFNYNSKGLLNSVTDNAYRGVSFEYDSNDNLTEIIDANKNKTIYQYDSSNRIIKGIGPDNKTIFTNVFDNKGRIISQNDSDNRSTSFTYDETSKPGSVITTAKDRKGNSKVLTHNYNYQLISNKKENGDMEYNSFDQRGNITESKDGRGFRTKYTYDDKGNLLSIIDPLSRKTTMKYDKKDNLTQVVNDKGYSVDNTYDENNHLIKSVDEKNNETTYSYDIKGELTSKTSNEDETTLYLYKNGLAVSTISPQGITKNIDYDAVGRPIAVSDAKGNKVLNYYDNDDNIVKTVDPLNNENSFVYDMYNNKISHKDAKGNITNYKYNTYGKLISKIDPLNNETKYEYDYEGNLIKVIDPKGNSINYTVDGKGRTTEVKDALGNTVKTSYDANDNIISKTDSLGNTVLSTTYNEKNKPVKTVDALGRTTFNEYDTLDRLTKSIDGLGRETTYDYDQKGQLISSKDSNLSEASQSYDANGNVISMYDANDNSTNYKYNRDRKLIKKTDDLYNTNEYYYDILGLLTKTKNGRGFFAEYSYDEAGKVTTMKDPIGTLTYSYDKNGNISNVSDGSGNISRKYDALNRIVSYTDANGNTIGYEYDKNGNISSLTYPGNKKVTYNYDVANRLIKVTDWANRITSYEYNGNGSLVKETKANGVVTMYSYDKMGQTTSITDTNNKGNLINSFNYTYDNVGNVLSSKGAFDNHNIKVQSTVMEYGRGNRIYNFNRQSVYYDDDGNMTDGPLNGKINKFTYDARNRLTAVGNTKYVYDGENNRIATVEDGKRTSYVVNTNSKLSEVLVSKDDSTGKETYYIYGLGLIGEESSDGYKTYHYDKNGDTTAIADSNGNITDKIQYEPYGKITYRSGSTKTPFLFVGKSGIMTDSNGLYYMRARYYNPEIRRFINEDVVTGNIDNTQGLNRYAYAQGNPNVYIDEDGHWVHILIGAGVGALIDGGSKITENVSEGKGWSDGVLSEAVGGAVNGAITAAFPEGGVLSDMVGNTTKGIVSRFIDQINDDKEGIDFNDISSDIFKDMKDGALDSYIGDFGGELVGKIGGKFGKKLNNIWNDGDEYMEFAHEYWKEGDKLTIEDSFLVAKSKLSGDVLHKVYEKIFKNIFKSRGKEGGSIK